MVLLEGVGAELELVPVDLYLLAQQQQHALRVPGHEGVLDVDWPLLEHDHDHMAQGVLDGLGGEHAHTVGLLVDCSRAHLWCLDSKPKLRST